VDSDISDTSDEPTPDEQPESAEQTDEGTTPAAIVAPDADEVADPDGGSDDPDWELVLAQISRDTDLTKKLVGILIVVVIVASVVLGVLIRTTDKSTSTAAAKPSTTTTSSTVPALESVAGQPCVALVDPLPAGAPPIDIVVGPAPTSLVVKDIKEGTGAEATATGTVTVNYVGVACSTGQIFDTSYKGGASTPVSLPLAQVIPGFGQGVAGMKVGGQRLIGIPSDQAYGSQGGGSAIAPDESLWFVVELTGVS
jgi:peptidylprolyl isomerase